MLLLWSLLFLYLYLLNVIEICFFNKQINEKNPIAFITQLKRKHFISIMNPHIVILKMSSCRYHPNNDIPQQHLSWEYMKFRFLLSSLFSSVILTIFTTIRSLIITTNLFYFNYQSFVSQFYYFFLVDEMIKQSVCGKKITVKVNRITNCNVGFNKKKNRNGRKTIWKVHSTRTFKTF